VLWFAKILCIVKIARFSAATAVLLARVRPQELESLVLDPWVQPPPSMNSRGAAARALSCFCSGVTPASRWSAFN
jgi:hypothetical protein